MTTACTHSLIREDDASASANGTWKKITPCFYLLPLRVTPFTYVCMHAENKNGNTICLVIIFNNECVANLTDFGKRENEATVKLT